MPFIIQARRAADRDTIHSLRAYCEIPKWHAGFMQYTYGLSQYYTASNLPHHILLVPYARIISVNGATIPPEWIIECRYTVLGIASENIMLIDTRLSTRDFSVEEVY